MIDSTLAHLRALVVLATAAGAAIASGACSGQGTNSLPGDLSLGDDGGAALEGDAASNGTSGDDASATAGDDAATTTNGGDAGKPSDAGKADAGLCIAAVSPPGSGHHNAGDDCASCHDSLSASRRWTLAGTLYTKATGGVALSGATIEVVDANGKVVTMATNTNGNFYTTTPVTFPVHTRASKCPNDARMVATAAQGSCNRSSCHVSGMRIHLP